VKEVSNMRSDALFFHRNQSQLLVRKHTCPKTIITKKKHTDYFKNLKGSNFLSRPNTDYFKNLHRIHQSNNRPEKMKEIKEG
jgi:hypothetical protein